MGGYKEKGWGVTREYGGYRGIGVGGGSRRLA